MHRRRYLTALGLAGTTALAGCSQTEGPAAEATENDGSTATENSRSNATSGTDTGATSTTSNGDDTATANSTETEGAIENGTATGPSGSSQLNVGQANFNVSTEGDIPAASAGARVVNPGPMLGKVTATATLYDSSGNEISTESHSIAALPSGKEWAALVVLIGDGVAEADSLDFSTEHNPTPPEFTMDGLEQRSSDLRKSGGEVTVNGEVKNTSDSSMSQLTATVFLHLDEVGNKIFATLQDSTNSLEGGGSWSYQVSAEGSSTVVGQKTRYTYE